MNKEKNKKYLIGAIGVITLIIATIGATFAYFSSTSSTKEESIKTGSLKLDATSSELTSANIKPTTWNDVMASNVANEDIAQLKLSVDTYGTTIEDAKYNIYLTTTGIAHNSNNRLEGGILKDIKWKLVNSNNEVINTGDFSKVDYSKPIKLTKSPITIEKKDTKEEATQTYLLFIYIDNKGQENQLQDLIINGTLSAKAVQ